jgi:7-cyano-7-deazaguanine synthase
MKATTDKAAVVMLSGGMDSTVLLHWVRRERAPRIHALSFDYGQRHRRELDCAREQAEAAGAAEHAVLDVTFFGDVVREGTSLVGGGAEVPDLSSLDAGGLDQPPTYVPNRNMTLLSIAAAFAEARGVTDIHYGAQAHDEYGYWDCTAEFVERVNAVLALNRRDRVTVHAPFVYKKKSELVPLGLELGVDFARTWSCYRGQSVPCHTCPTCVERDKAFAEAGAEDPLGGGPA